MPDVPRVDEHELAACCRRHGIAQLQLFGSAVRGDLRANSDLDVLYTLRPGQRWSFDDYLDARDALSRLLGREVDLVERAAVEQSPNYIKRAHILREARPLYVER